MTPGAAINGLLKTLKFFQSNVEYPMSPVFSPSKQAPGYVVQVPAYDAVTIQATAEFSDGFLDTNNDFNAGVTRWDVYINNGANVRTDPRASSSDFGNRVIQAAVNPVHQLSASTGIQNDAKYFLNLNYQENGGAFRTTSYFFRIERDPTAPPQVGVRQNQVRAMEGISNPAQLNHHNCFPDDGSADCVNHLTAFVQSDIRVRAADYPDGLDVRVRVVGADNYVIASERTQTVTIPVGETSAPVRIPIDDDTLDEPAARYHFELLAPAAAGDDYNRDPQLSRSPRAGTTLTLTDNDNARIDVFIAPTAGAGSVTEAAGAELSFTLTTDVAVDVADHPDGLSVSVTLTGGDAYVAAGQRTQTVTIPVNAMSAPVTFPLTNDEVDEPDATVTATIAEGGTVYNGGGASATAEAVDDDDSPVPATPTDFEVEQVSQTLSFTASWQYPASGATVTAWELVIEEFAGGDVRLTVPAADVTPTGGVYSITIPTHIGDATALSDGTGARLAALTASSYRFFLFAVNAATRSDNPAADADALRLAPTAFTLSPTSIIQGQSTTLTVTLPVAPGVERALTVSVTPGLLDGFGAPPGELRAGDLRRRFHHRHGDLHRHRHRRHHRRHRHLHFRRRP